MNRRLCRTHAATDPYGEYGAMVRCAMTLLTGRQRRLLEIHIEDRCIDFAEQLCLRLDNERCPVSDDPEEIKDRIKWALGRTAFLMESALPPHIIRHLVVTEVLEATTLGPRSRNLRDISKLWSGRRRLLGSGSFGILGLRQTGIGRFQAHTKILESAYPRIAEDWNNEAIPGRRPRTDFFRQLSFVYGLALVKVHRLEDYGGWFMSLLTKFHWTWEQLSRTHGAYNENKYKERLLCLLDAELLGNRRRGILGDLGLLLSRAEHRPVELGKAEELRAIVLEVLGCLDHEQLHLMDTVDSGGRPWRIEDQIRSRFGRMRASAASEEEIREHIGRKIAMYGPLMTEETADIVREILLDDLEEGLFVSEDTHEWNREMRGNLENLDPKSVNFRVVWAVNLIVESVNSSFLKRFSEEVDGRVYDLRWRLLARWSRARLRVSRRDFEHRLNHMALHTVHCPANWTKDGVAQVDLQAFLGVVDSMFVRTKERKKPEIIEAAVGAIGNILKRQETCSECECGLKEAEDKR